MRNHKTIRKLMQNNRRRNLFPDETNENGSQEEAGAASSDQRDRSPIPARSRDSSVRPGSYDFTDALSSNQTTNFTAIRSANSLPNEPTNSNTNEPANPESNPPTNLLSAQPADTSFLTSTYRPSTDIISYLSAYLPPNQPASRSSNRSANHPYQRPANHQQSTNQRSSNSTDNRQKNSSADHHQEESSSITQSPILFTEPENPNEYRRIYLPHPFEVRRMDDLDFQDLVESIFEKGSLTSFETLAFLHYIERCNHIGPCNVEEIVGMAPILLRYFITKYAANGLIDFIVAIRQFVGKIPIEVCMGCNPIWPQWENIATASHICIIIRTALDGDTQWYDCGRSPFIVMRFEDETLVKNVHPSTFKSGIVNSYAEIPFEFISFNFSHDFRLWREQWQICTYEGSPETWVERQIIQFRNRFSATIRKFLLGVAKIRRLKEIRRRCEYHLKQFKISTRSSFEQAGFLMNLFAVDLE